MKMRVVVLTLVPAKIKSLYLNIYLLFAYYIVLPGRRGGMIT
jgi:hypothetical protein